MSATTRAADLVRPGDAGDKPLLMLGAAIADLVRSHSADVQRSRVVDRPPPPAVAPHPERPTVTGRHVSNRNRPESFLDYRPMAVGGATGSRATSDLYAQRILHVDGRESRPWSPGATVRSHAIGGSGSRITTTETVIGHDDRIRIYDTENHPWRMIVNLQISTGRKGEVALGTGFFVGRDIILTAGHCVYDATTGGWPEEISVRPGQDGTTFPYGEHVSRRFATVTEWHGDGDIDFDYGVIQLDEPVGDETGWFGLGVFPGAELQGREVNVCGYPADMMGGLYQFHSTSSITALDDHRIYHRSDTAPGTSGAATWISRSDHADELEHIVVAVHTNGTGAPTPVGVSEVNSGTRLTPQIVEDVRFWNENGV